ncbi:MAG: hypothetical protein U9N78_00705, partial [Actinomycetota bacterium]|nr:hypothetical protein [Actinomycetota bacterium]
MELVPYDASAVARLLERAGRADGHAPLSGHKLEVIGADRSRTGTWADASVICAVGVAAFHEASAHWAVEVAVAPERRSSQVEKEAILAAAGLVPDSAAHTIWAFRPAQLKAAGLIGYREIRAVLRMAGP